MTCLCINDKSTSSMYIVYLFPLNLWVWTFLDMPVFMFSAVVRSLRSHWPLDAAARDTSSLAAPVTYRSDLLMDPRPAQILQEQRVWPLHPGSSQHLRFKWLLHNTRHKPQNLLRGHCLVKTSSAEAIILMMQAFYKLQLIHRCILSQREDL